MSNPLINMERKSERYLEALQKCSEVAAKEAEILSNEKIPLLKEHMEESSLKLRKFLEVLDSDKDLEDELLKDMLFSFQQEIKAQLDRGLAHILSSLEQKRDNLTSFTVTLFGRTKAGKSTICEALTHGDGKGIGKGMQRTTRDIVEYNWNQLRVIDTPGIAAYEGDEDVEVAESVIDQSDVILFLVTSDSIQESEFAKLAELKSQNKPLIVLLNVKQDISHPLRQKLFLYNWETIVSKSGQKGHIERIQNYTKSHLGFEEIDVIPIHAQAAYLSTIEKDVDLKNQLYAASQVENLKQRIENLVIREGIQLRTKTFRDSYIFYLNSLENIYWSSYKDIEPRVTFLNQKINKLQRWFKDFKYDRESLIRSRVKRFLSPLYEQAGNFVDEYAGNPEADKAWKSIVRDLHIDREVENICSELVEEVEEHLKEFTRQLQFEFSFFNFSQQGHGVKDVNKGVMGRVVRWGGAAFAVGGAVVNFWNPVGWVIGSIAIGGAVASIFSWVFGDDTKRYEKQKDKIKQQIIQDIKNQERRVINRLITWLRNELILDIEQKLTNSVSHNLEVMKKLLDELEMHAHTIDTQINQENLDLIGKLYFQTFGQDIRACLSGIGREQGVLTKILYKNDQTVFFLDKREEFEAVLGERIIYVPFISEPIELLQRSIFPARLEPSRISFNVQQNKYKVTMCSEEMNNLIGENGVHIKTARKMLRCSIDIVRE